ncbi:MAG TPA: tetratricopeptide repeat protein, partial [Pyrinomonadaceae bacterium]|nr:tetratricopeptide repeat protein [Pyrinomonadaceae bacterium]
LIHYYYAFALSREGRGEGEPVNSFTPESLSKMREHLMKAIEMRPDFPESYSLLAFVNLVSGTNLDESIQMLKRALVSSPGRNDLVFMLAQVYMRKEDFQIARELLQKLSANNSDAELSQRAQSMLAQLINREEELARYKNAAGSPDNRPTVQSTVNSGGQSELVVASTDPSSYLREALRKPEAGETQTQGLLRQIDCDAKGITFTVQVGGEILKLTTPSFDDVDLTSFSPDGGNEIKCGPRKPENNVIVDYVPASDARAKTNGVAKSIEFVPKDFKLKAGP